jgi:hypothetical protein
MTCFAQTSDGDLDLSTHALVLVTDPARETLQRLRNRLYLGKGEWFADTDAGMPYVQFILGAATPAEIPTVRRLFAGVIARTPGVAHVLKCDLVREGNTRNYQLVFEARLDTGERIVGGPGDRFLVERT